jgi:hypothetical protein
MATEQSNPTDRAHAKLSASQTKRWMTCPGSVRYIDDMPAIMKRGSSSFAQLGTAAHSLVEECLREGRKESRLYRGYWISLDGSINKQKRDPDAFEVDLDMMDAVDVMLRTVWTEHARLGPEVELMIEHQFDLSWVRPNMFGTNDVSLSQFLEELVVIDYKHGQGVPVEVSVVDKATGKHKGNSQLLYYALGAAHKYDFTHTHVTIIVVQPRCPHPLGGVRRFTCSMDELLEFRETLALAADVVMEAYNEYPQYTQRGKEEHWQDKFLVPGEHCKSAFCPALAVCPSLHRLAEREAVADFSEEPPASLPAPKGVESLGRALLWVPVLDARNRAVEALAQRLAEQGVKVPGHKLVRKRANRQWLLDEEGVVARLVEIGADPKDFLTQPKLASPAVVEKISSQAKQLVNGHRLTNDTNWQIEPIAAKGQGGITLAHESDPRAEVIIDPAADFPKDEALAALDESDV